MRSLKRQRSDLDAESTRLRLQLRAAARKASKLNRPVLREPCRSIARALVATHDGEPTAAVEYVRRNRRMSTKDKETVDMTSVEAELRAWWRGVDAATKEKHLVPSKTNNKLQKAIRTAARFKVDADLEMWVDAQNMQKGISPVPGQMIGRANEIKTGHGVPTPKTRKGCCKWLARWRRRRTVRLRSMQAHERLSVEEMHHKVTSRLHPHFLTTHDKNCGLPPGRLRKQKWFRFPVSIIGSFLDDGKRKWARFPAFCFFTLG